jgi:hypothetical protein
MIFAKTSLWDEIAGHPTGPDTAKVAFLWGAGMQVRTRAVAIHGPPRAARRLTVPICSAGRGLRPGLLCILAYVIVVMFALQS